MLVIAIAIAIEPSQPLPPIYALFALLTTLTAVAILSTALMRSDVDHRTEAVIDGLTGMLNRRALDQRLQELTAQARITGQPIAVIAGDIDHFKRVNDEHGHAAGDAVLVEVAYRLRKALRAFDLAIAWRRGVPGRPSRRRVPAAARLAEQLRAAVAAEPAAGLWVTMSFGVAGSPGLPASSANGSSTKRTRRSMRPRRGPRPVVAAPEPAAAPPPRLTRRQAPVAA